MSDITNFMQTFLSSIIDIFSTVFNQLSSITFNGISLLSYTIAVFVLTSAIPLVVSLLNNRSVGVSSVPRSYRNVRGAFKRRVDNIDGMWDISDD